MLSTVASAPKISIKGRWPKSRPPEISPGPGSYTPQPPPKAMAVTVSGRERQVTRIQGPGPGQYDRGLDKNQFGPQFSFGTSKRLQARAYARTPGPGSYSSTSLNKGVSITLQGRWKQPSRSKDGLSPGPGTYVPGAATDVRYDKAPKFGFGTSQRPEARNLTIASPGPGHYMNNMGFRAEGPKFSIKARDQQRQKPQLTPGPGAFGGITSFG